MTDPTANQELSADALAVSGISCVHCFGWPRQKKKKDAIPVRKAEVSAGIVCCDRAHHEKMCQVGQLDWRHRWRWARSYLQPTQRQVTTKIKQQITFT